MDGRFNGWIRAWIVCAIVWLTFLIGAKYDSFPSEESWSSDSQARQREILNERDRYIAALVSDCSGKAYVPESKAFVECLVANEKIKSGVTKDAWERVMLEGEWSAEKIEKKLLQEQLAFAFKLAACWLIPAGFVFLLGFLVSWARKGFVRK